MLENNDRKNIEINWKMKEKQKERKEKAFDNKTNRCYTEINFSEVNLSIASKRG